MPVAHVYSVLQAQLPEHLAAESSEVAGHYQIIVHYSPTGIAKVRCQRVHRCRRHCSSHIVDIGDAEIRNLAYRTRSYEYIAIQSVAFQSRICGYATACAGHCALCRRRSLATHLQRVAVLPFGGGKMAGSYAGHPAGIPSVYEHTAYEE